MIPVAIDFSRIFTEKILYPETIQYKILKDLEESEWQKYKGKMLKENISVKYDSLIDAFVAIPLKEDKSIKRPWENKEDLKRFVNEERDWAYRAGEKNWDYSEKVNPYKKGTKQYVDWIRGWEKKNEMKAREGEETPLYHDEKKLEENDPSSEFLNDSGINETEDGGQEKGKDYLQGLNVGIKGVGEFSNEYKKNHTNPEWYKGWQEGDKKYWQTPDKNFEDKRDFGHHGFLKDLYQYNESEDFKNLSNKIKLAESKFARTMGKFTDYTSKVVSALKRSGVEDGQLNLNNILSGYNDGLNSRECAKRYIEMNKINESKLKSLKEKELLLDDGDDDEETDFDSDMNTLLDFDDEDDNEDDNNNDDEALPSNDEESDDSHDEVEVAQPSGEEDVNLSLLSSKLEALINQVLDNREAKTQYSTIPTGDASNNIGDFGNVAEVSDEGVVENETLESEFPQVQDRLNVVKDKIESELTYQDYLNGDMTNDDNDDDDVIVIDDGDSDDFDAFNFRSDNYDEAGQTEIDDSMFKRNAALTVGKTVDDDELLLDDSNEIGDEEELPEVMDTTIEHKGQPIRIILTGIALEESEIKTIARQAGEKGIRIKKIVTEAEDSKENGYVAFYKGKRKEVYATSSYEAQKKAAKEFGAKKSWEVSVTLAEKNGKQVTHVATESKKPVGLNIFAECEDKIYKIHYEDIPASRNKMPFSIKDNKFQNLPEAFDKIKLIHSKKNKEISNFKKFVTEDVIKREAKSPKSADIFDDFKKAKNINGWNVKSLGTLSLKTGINEVLSNITTNNKDKNTLVKTNEGQYFLIKGSLNERSKVGTKSQLVDMGNKREYGTAEVVGVYQNDLKGLGKIMEKIQRTNIPLLIWK